ncbi:Glucan 1,3-beta-glucosidase [Penicillium ucsense]|uniref:glucan 1,3-beta-glucosidase n=1 Tax=Penicillium ucsense TaxID=2839758 RepID=A0A8J8WAY0_9EURO|nr:Glucan 1,3-beta-glucosidase [Penicillium ucsense]KAF7738723.1 Glucan 1,3-beta-glucosidase [Penicillium ucsense]
MRPLSSSLALLGVFHLALASPINTFSGSSCDPSSEKHKPGSIDDYINWRTFSGHGVNLGGWLEQESTIDTTWWSTYGANAADEWTICANLGPEECSRVFEARYRTFITTSDIDRLAGAGVSILRIPTTYAAWVRVPGSQLYSGHQQEYLRKIADHAIKKHGMHIILDLHSLPGGTNGLDIGEKVGNWGWWHNETALEWSLRAVDAVVAFVQSSTRPQSYTIEPINEPVDNRDFATFGTPAALSDLGAQWLLKYFREVIARVKKVNPRIPVMLQGSFQTEEFWSPHFEASENIVFDLHHYYFQFPQATSANVSTYICGDARASAGDGKFPTFVGEWAIETGGRNELALRGQNLQAGLSAWSQFTRGSTYWTAKFWNNATVVGEGIKQDYWNYEEMIAEGTFKGKSLIKDFCS